MNVWGNSLVAQLQETISAIKFEHILANLYGALGSNFSTQLKFQLVCKSSKVTEESEMCKGSDCPGWFLPCSLILLLSRSLLQ